MSLPIVKKLLPLFLLTIFITNTSWRFNEPQLIKKEFSLFETYNPFLHEIDIKYNLLYDSLNLDISGLSQQAFLYAVTGFEALKKEGLIQNDSIITIVDFDQPSYNKRMYILDIKNYKMLFNNWAAHGKNSGQAMATHFSNRNSSNQSSLGFYLTDKTYYGGNGFSLKLVGLEKGLNDMALQRAIVLHGAPYVSQASINELGFLGRSFGCPAVPTELCKPIIETIKEGSCLFIYNKSYHSSLLLDY